MMMMSPQTVGLITFCLAMNVLNICIAMENPHSHDQPLTVLQLLRRFLPFINPARPIAEPMTAIKYFHTSPRHNSRFLYAKKRRYPEEPHISRDDFGIHATFVPTLSRAKKTAFSSNFNNEFPYPIQVSHLFLPREHLNSERNFYLQRRNTNYRSASMPTFLHHNGVKRNDNPDHVIMDYPHSTKYEEIDLPRSKILEKLKKYNPLYKLSRRIDLLTSNSEVERIDHSPEFHKDTDQPNKVLLKLPLQNNKNHPYIHEPEPPFKKVLTAASENEMSAPHSGRVVWTLRPNKPIKHFNEFHLSNVPAVSLEDTFLSNLLKHINTTSSEELDHVHSHLRWNWTCVSLRNECVLMVNRDNDGNYCLSIYAKANATDNRTLNHILKQLGKPCKLKTTSEALSVSGSTPQKANKSDLGISPKRMLKDAIPYKNFTNMQRKGRMLKVIEGDLMPSTGQNWESTISDETTNERTESVSFSPSTTTSLIDRRNGDLSFSPTTTTSLIDRRNSDLSFSPTTTTSLIDRRNSDLSFSPSTTTSLIDRKNSDLSFSPSTTTSLIDGRNSDLSFSTSTTASLVDRRNGDYVAYITAKPDSELDVSNKTETGTIQYNVSLLPAVERKNDKVVPSVTEEPESGTVEEDSTDDRRTVPLDVSEVSAMVTSAEDEATSLENTDDLFHGSTPRILNLRASEHTRQGKMTEIHGVRDKSADRSMNVFGRRFRTEDYESEIVDRSTSQNVAVFAPEFKPGSLSNFSITFRRQPIKHMSVSDTFETTKTDSDGKPRRYFYNIKEKSFRNPTTETPSITEDVRVIGSTFFPNRMHKGSMHFGKRNMNSSTDNSSKEDTDQRNSLQEEGDFDDGEGEITAQEAGFTMEKLAYLLIGTCCCLSIICLMAVIAAIRCRRVLIERRLRNRLFRHNVYHSSIAPWQQHIYDPFLYLNGRPPASLSSRDSCNCRCVTWSLGARNLDTRPICPTRSSIYLTGPKNLPFGAASTLCYETMMHAERRKPTIRPRPPPRLPPKSEESSNENDSLDPSSDADNSTTNEKRCTCIHPSWARTTESSNAVYNTRPVTKPIRKKASRCPHSAPCRRETGTPMLNGDCPPPVSGSDYLDRTDGVVYWSSNDERLI